MIVDLQTRVKVAVKQAAFKGIASVLGLIGLGFFTAALFLVLAETRDALFALLVIGGGYFGLALIFLALGIRQPRAKVPPAPAAQNTQAQMAIVFASFLQGVMQGRAARRDS